MNSKTTLLLFFTLISFSINIWAIPASGSFTATQSCDAYVSKNKRTNPGDVLLVVNKKYDILEVNKPNNPSWYRVHVTHASPKQRWVAKHCGTVNLLTGGDGGSDNGNHVNACNTPGLGDSHVLALSWQPAFCETHRDKPECRVDNKKSYQAQNFTLHGLWPNKKSCGTKYGFCGDVRRKPGDFCDYPMLSMFTEARADLESVMPSAAAGSCLQRHEWHKHGTCQADWSVDEYYEVAVDLTKQFNRSGIAYFISRNIGKEVSEASFKEKIDCAHGEGAHKHIELKCKSGNLVDVYINLPKTINKNSGIGDLMQQAQGNFKSNCGGSFKIDPIGYF